MKQNTFIRTAFMLSAILLFCNIHTHAQQWQWAQTYFGSTAGDSGNQNYILKSHLDTAGNVYMFGRFGAGATRNNTSTLLDDERAGQSGWKNGVIVGKMGADGEFIWKKVVRSNNSNTGRGRITPQWAEFKDDAIYVMFNFECYTDGASTNKLHFFGVEKNRAEIAAINAPPFKTGYWTALVKFSYDGEVLDQHFIQIRNRNSPLTTSRSSLPPLTPFHVDNSGNTYIFTRISVAAGLVTEPITLFFDNTTTHDFTIPKTEQANEPMIIKLNANWQFQWIKPMYYNVTDNSNATANNPDNFFTGLSFDENDNMYLTGIIALYNNPLYIYFDPNHRLVMNDNTYLAQNGYIVKYNTEGNSQWCNQLYSGVLICQRDLSGSVISNNDVFVLGGTGSGSRFYNGNDYVEITSTISNQNSKAFVAKFNKTTGLYQNHGIIPNESGTGLLFDYQVPSEPAIINDYIVATSTIGLNQKDKVVASFRTDNCQFVEVLDTIKFANVSMGETSGSVSGNSNGDMFIHFISPSNTMTLGNLPPVYISGDNAVFALKNDPRLRIPLFSKVEETPENSGIKIYLSPNPTKDILHIGTAFNGNLLPVENIEIIDIAGRTLETRIKRSYANGTFTLNVSALPQGTYLLKLYTDRGVLVERFVKN